MSVPDKCIQAVYDNVRQLGGGVKLDPRKLAQSVINAVWTKFDLEDKSTHPKGVNYIVSCGSGGLTFASFINGEWCVLHSGQPNVKITDRVTHFTDPNNFKFMETK